MVGGHLLRPDGNQREGEGREEAVMGELTGARRGDGWGVLAAEEARLGHFQQAAYRGRHIVVGNTRWPGQWPAGKASPVSSNHGDKH
jgi:hypothetical protein